MGPHSFRILFHFKASGAATGKAIFEVERVDVAKSRPPAERFQWFFCDSTSQELLPLDFESMGKAGEHSGWRQFFQGRLEFDSDRAQFAHNFSGTTGHIELLRTVEPLSERLAGRVTQFLGGTDDTLL